MKKLNKKGFTLVELIAALVILTIIMMIAIPSITSSIERNKQKQKEKKIALIESTASVYVANHNNNITSSSCYISIYQMLSSGLLSKKDINDPTNTSVELDGCVLYTRSTGTYVYQPSSCSNMCVDSVE